MAADFNAVVAALKPILARHEDNLSLRSQSADGYMLYSRTPSPFPQHKGEPLFFGAIRSGKGYVSFHLMPIYMCPELTLLITAALKKRMQGKACFNFRTVPDAGTISDLQALTDASFKLWRKHNWL